MEWKKIFANQISDKVLIFKIHEELIQLNSKKKKNLIKKRVEKQNRHIFQEDMPKANRYVKRYSTSDH